MFWSTPLSFVVEQMMPYQPAAGSSACYPFAIGHFRCLAISDGYHAYRVDHFFANVSGKRLSAVLGQRGMSAQTIVTPYTCLFIDDGRQRILVDAGAGAILPTAGSLVSNMAAAGLSPEAIDTLIITHAHPDHIGGLLNENGRPVFPNAKVLIARAEYDFWFDDIAFNHAPATFVQLAREQLSAVRRRLALINGETEICAGLKTLAAPGHTPGQLALSIKSGSDRLLHISDIALSPLHLEYPTWRPIYDIEPEKAAESKRRVFDQAAADAALIFGHHFPPFPALGHVVEHGAGWQWRPISTHSRSRRPAK